MIKILACDDEKDIVKALKIYLTTEGFEVIEANTGKEAVEAVERNEDIKLILMDVMMPEMSGIDATMKIREKYNMPIIMLTSKDEYSDKILGLQIGADDYITKPFNPIEVVARVKSQIRRYTQLGSEILNDDIYINGGIKVDDKSKSIYLDGEPISVTPTEYSIIKLFVQNPGEVILPKEIYKKVWNDDPYGTENTVLVHIRHIREKIEIDPSNPRYIIAVWGHGYKMEKR